MNIDDIYNEISILEDSPLTSENARDLASLYIIKEEYEKRKSGATSHDSGVIKELKDILPSYQYYINAKTTYQLTQANDEQLLTAFKLLCQDISEFMVALYASMDMVKERKIYKEMLDNLTSKIF